MPHFWSFQLSDGVCTAKSSLVIYWCYILSQKIVCWEGLRKSEGHLWLLQVTSRLSSTIIQCLMYLWRATNMHLHLQSFEYQWSDPFLVKPIRWILTRMPGSLTHFTNTAWIAYLKSDLSVLQPWSYSGRLTFLAQSTMTASHCKLWHHWRHFISIPNIANQLPLRHKLIIHAILICLIRADYLTDLTSDPSILQPLVIQQKVDVSCVIGHSHLS